MEEQKKFRGLFCCPDLAVRLSDEPPFRYKCSGMVMTDQGAKEFEAELWRTKAARN